ncbi:unnamed protein product [Meloidogyne enterolobii]|uniref:Uncharacterized protein n=1 Tax=Meloidogyne enterolobii TaxID=390850 RepID=A0ACB0YCH9_MELEN
MIISRKLPIELTSEIITSIPLNQKWENIRVSGLFDILIIKHQKEFIIKLKFEYKSMHDVIGEIFKQLGVVDEYVPGPLVSKLKYGTLCNLSGMFDGLFECLHTYFLKYFIALHPLMKKTDAVKWPNTIPDLDQFGVNNCVYMKLDIMKDVYKYFRDLPASEYSYANSPRDLFVEFGGLLKGQLWTLQSIVKLCKKYGAEEVGDLSVRSETAPPKAN